ncbi:hypothetical protein NUU61_004292 [Penicillium alfredii]|uniref:F-box domain-containing protein n=1 Tax=Penicillium alfredii TaxID=1506179 RepID=A0A9W9FKY1_9EURO|nr:uncharacterized protein NUU61_004292 [Penicillium alfredii]KAJ5102070.1 hypothetical protein NUU61_004292 [Penicillium alfredii]
MADVTSSSTLPVLDQRAVQLAHSLDIYLQLKIRRRSILSGDERHLIKFITSNYLPDQTPYFPRQFSRSENGLKQAAKLLRQNTEQLRQTQEYLTWKEQLQSLLTIPLEILLQITSGLSTKDLNALTQVSRYFEFSLTDTLYRRHKDSVLRWGVRREMPGTVCKALHAGANPNVKYRGEWSVLWRAVCGRNKVALRDLARIGDFHRVWRGEFLDKTTQLGHQSQYQIVQLLLAFGADPNTRMRQMSVLYLACVLSSHELMKLLLKAGANPNGKNSRHQTALHAAAWKMCWTSIELLMETPGIDPDPQDLLGCTPLAYGARTPMRFPISSMKKFMQRPEINVNQEDGEGRTPLYHSIEAGNHAVSRMLLKEPRVDPNAGGDENMPLFFAVRRNMTLMVELLLSHKGIRPNLGTASGLTPIMQAKADHNEDLVGLLLAAGADFKIPACPMNHRAEPTDNFW